MTDRTGTGTTTRGSRRLWLLGIVTAMAVVACAPGPRPGPGGGGTTPPPAWRYPGDEWETVPPAEAGLDAAILDGLAAEAEAAGSTCMVVTRDGAVVDERYWQGATADTPREAWSVTKSVTSVLAGIAEDEGALSLTDPAADHIPEWQGTESEAVTVDNLLRNDSGRHWSIASDYVEMAIRAPDKTAYAIGLAQDSPPGEVWAYNNAAVQTLSAVLESATGRPAKDYAEEVLFDRIGMARSDMTTDQAGNTLTFMGMQSTCLDLARFGYLMMRDGAWDGEQVVSEDYVEQAVGGSSTPLNAAYGRLFWLNREGRIVSPLLATGGAGGGSEPVTEGQVVPGAPDDIFWALGFNNQVVTVIPSEGVVAVRMGPKPPADAPFSHVEMTEALLEAAGEP